MDFGQFDTKTGAGEGRFMHLRHVKTGEKIYDGDDPVGIDVRGMESKVVLDAINASNREEVKTGEGDDNAIAKAVIIKFHGIDRDGKPLTTSDDDLKWFFDLSSSFRNQVVKFSGTVGNFLPAK